MAQKYLEQLVEIMEEVRLCGGARLECKHFFSGAACYINDAIFASLTPVGFALKLPETYRVDLIQQGAKPLKYFPKAPIKKEYVVLTQSMVNNANALSHLVEISAKYARARNT